MTGPRFVLVCGSGGVGKTTTSAAIGLNAARGGERVLVITVDPAKRLAQALGMGEPGQSTPMQVEGGGTLTAWMLDTKAGWDTLIRRHAKDERTAERVLRNPLYDNITSRFVNSHDYIAMEQVNELSSSDEYDVVVVDTPPSRNALALLDAPRRMKEFFGGRVLQWLTLPYRNKLMSLASRPFLAVADRLLGAQLLGDVAEVFSLLQSMESGFVARAAQVESLLSSDRVECVVVTTAETAAVTEAELLARSLHARGMNVSTAVVNKVVTVPSPGETIPDVAEVTAHVTGIDVAGAFAEVAVARRRQVETAARHQAGIERMRTTFPAVCTVPLAHGRESALQAIGGALPSP